MKNDCLLRQFWYVRQVRQFGAYFHDFHVLPSTFFQLKMNNNDLGKVMWFVPRLYPTFKTIYPVYTAPGYIFMIF